MSLKDKLQEMQFSILGKNNKLPVGQKTLKSALVGNTANGYNLGRLANLSASGVVLAGVDSPIQGVISESTADDSAVLITYESEDINVLVDAPVGINTFLYAGADGKLTATAGTTPAVAISLSASFTVGAEKVVAVKLI